MTENLKSASLTITSVCYLIAVFGIFYIFQSWILIPLWQPALIAGTFPSTRFSLALESQYLPVLFDNLTPPLKESIYLNVWYPELYSGKKWQFNGTHLKQCYFHQWIRQKERGNKLAVRLLAINHQCWENCLLRSYSLKAMDGLLKTVQVNRLLLFFSAVIWETWH